MIILPNATLSVQLDYTKEWLEVEKQGHDAHDVCGAWRERVGKLKGIDQTCNGHVIWVTYTCESKTFQGANTEIKRIDQKIRRIIQDLKDNGARPADMGV